MRKQNLAQLLAHRSDSVFVAPFERDLRIWLRRVSSTASASISAGRVQPQSKIKQLDMPHGEI